MLSLGVSCSSSGPDFWVGILRAIRSMKTKEVPDRESLIVRNGAGRGVLGGQYRDGMAGGPKTCLHGSARTICKKRKQAVGTYWQWRRPGVPVPGSFAEGFGMWPWDDGNELPRVIQVIRVKGSCTFSFLQISEPTRATHRVSFVGWKPRRLKPLRLLPCWMPPLLLWPGYHRCRN